MKAFSNIALVLLVFAALSLPSNAVNTGNNDAEVDFNQWSEDGLKLQQDAKFRSVRSACADRGESCDHRPDYCCESLKCRCNLWGANCRCQRAGIF